MRVYKMLILTLLGVSLLVGSVQTFQIVSELPADEEVIFSLCSPSARACTVTVTATCLDCPGNGKPLPPVGKVCRLVGANVLDCGGRYQRLLVR